MKLTKRGKRLRALLILIAIFVYVTLLLSERVYGDCYQGDLGYTCTLKHWIWWWNK
jgi:hypothetical protein